MDKLGQITRTGGLVCSVDGQPALDAVVIISQEQADALGVAVGDVLCFRHYRERQAALNAPD